MYLIPITFAFSFYLVAFGWHTLNPFEISWVMYRDSTVHFLGWSFFYQDGWHYPLGKISNMMEPIGASLVATDSIPILSIFFKFFFGWIKQPFQFMGFWMLACYLLMAFWSYRLIALLTSNKTFAALASIFFTLSPVLLYRSDHKSLCAHWLILWMFYLYANVGKNARIPLFSLFAANALSVGFHPYLFPMTFALTLAVYANALFPGATKENTFKYLGQICGILSITFLLMHALGYFLISSPASGGFGLFSTDLLGFFNSMQKSSLIPKIRHGSSQHEGFAYLGLGMILLLFVAIWKKSKKAPQLGSTLTVQWRPLVIVCALMYVFALSSHITFGGNTIIKLEWFYNLLGSIPGTFRSSARFLWPLYYLIMVGILITVFKHTRVRMAYSLLILMAVLQVVDLGQWYAARSERANVAPEVFTLLKSNFWDRMREKNIRHLVMVPPMTLCDYGAFHPHLVQAILLKTTLNNMSANSGFYARASDEEKKLVCEAFWAKLKEEDLRHTLFVASSNADYSEKLHEFLAGINQKFQCNFEDGVNLCLPVNNP